MKPARGQTILMGPAQPKTEQFSSWVGYSYPFKVGIANSFLGSFPESQCFVLKCRINSSAGTWEVPACREATCFMLCKSVWVRKITYEESCPIS